MGAPHTIHDQMRLGCARSSSWAVVALAVSLTLVWTAAEVDILSDPSFDDAGPKGKPRLSRSSGVRPVWCIASSVAEAFACNLRVRTDTRTRPKMGDPLPGAITELQLDQTSKSDPVTNTYMPSTEPKVNTYMPKADSGTNTYLPSAQPKVNTYMPKAGSADAHTSRSKQKAPEDELKKLWRSQDPMGMKSMLTASTEKKSIKKKLSKVDAKISKATEPLKKSKLQVEKAQLQGALKVVDSKLKKKQTARDSSKKKITEKMKSMFTASTEKKSIEKKLSKVDAKISQATEPLLIEGEKSASPDFNKKKSIEKKLSQVDAKISK